MDGCTFVSKLQSLAIPHSADLRRDDFDWVFLNEWSQPLSQFWRWFVTNISPDNVLQEEEINNYEDLQASGSVLSAEHLKKIESYLGSVSLEEENEFPLNFQASETIEDPDKLREDLKKLQTRKNFLSLQKLEVEDEIRARREAMCRLRQELQSRKKHVQTACSEHSNALERISSSVDAATAPLIPFAREGDKAVFLAQLPLQKWEEEEAAFKDALVTFIYKQFQEGIERLAGEANSSAYCLLDSRQLAILQFVRGPGQARHQMQVKELDRLNAMLETTEVEAAEYDLLKAQKDAEVSETHRFLKMLRSRAPSPAALIRQQTASLEEAAEGLLEDAETHRQLAVEEASSVAQSERKRVLSSSYELKLQRQAYYLSKLEKVKEFVLHRGVRLNLAKMAFEVERNRVRALVEVIVRLHALLGTHRYAHIARMENLALLKEWLEDGSATRKEEEILTHLLAPLITPKDDNSGPDVSCLTRQLQSSLKGSERELRSASEAQFECVNQLYASCGRLEECLFGARGFACELPQTWVSVATAERVVQVEDGVWELQQRMLDPLRDYERKKKLISDNPSVASDLTKWTRSGSQKAKS